MKDFVVWFKGGRDPLLLRGESTRGEAAGTLVIRSAEGISWEINLSEVVLIQSKEVESGEE